MSGPHAEGEHLPPLGSRYRGLVTSEDIECRHASATVRHEALVKCYPSGQFEVAVMPTPGWATAWRSDGIADPHDPAALRELAATMLAAAGWALTGDWKYEATGVHRAPVARRAPGRTDRPGEHSSPGV